MGRTFDGVKVFTATKAREREEIGETITAWLAEYPEIDIVDKVVTQSSDNEFHCLTITLFFIRRDGGSPKSKPAP
ncbi:MAG: hypothetical protein HC923_05135 [Myxococcales bacterium]|nr:hypothetical protein [Myxococcales bacterium]